MTVEVLPAAITDKSVIRHLLELYSHDFSEYDDADVDEHGLYGYDHLDAYWTDDSRFPFLIRVDGKLAGFALVHDFNRDADGKPIHYIAEFFVMRKYRHKKVGEFAARFLFDRFSGTWRVAEVQRNVPAQVFWRRVIGMYTGSQYTDHQEQEWDGPVQEFVSTGR